MKYWTVDPTNNLTTPYLWTIDLIKGSTDNVSVYQTVQAGVPAVALRVIRSNGNNSQIWTTVHVRQDLHGQALKEIFTANISIDVFPTFQYLYDRQTKNPENAFGIEINDGTNLIWFIFADEPDQIFQLPHTRIVLTQTPLNVWSTRTINIATQYAAAGWARPYSLSFTLLLGTTWLHLGDWVGYFANLSVTPPALQTQTLSGTGTMMVLSADALVITFLAGAVIVYWKHDSRGQLKNTRRKVKINGG